MLESDRNLQLATSFRSVFMKLLFDAIQITSVKSAWIRVEASWWLSSGLIRLLWVVHDTASGVFSIILDLFWFWSEIFLIHLETRRLARQLVCSNLSGYVWRGVFASYRYAIILLLILLPVACNLLQNLMRLQESQFRVFQNINRVKLSPRARFLETELSNRADLCESRLRLG